MHTAVLLFDGFTDNETKANFAIILGTTVHENGQVSKRLKARLDAGLYLYLNELVDSIYVSGGFGKEGFFEGSKMKDYLISKGIPEDLIFVDNQGNNTRLTAVNFKKDFPKVIRVYALSQYFHVTRTKLALRQVGIQQVYGAHAKYFEWRDFYSVAREFLGFYVYAWRF